jgi:hypothetical protein
MTLIKNGKTPKWNREAKLSFDAVFRRKFYLIRIIAYAVWQA